MVLFTIQINQAQIPASCIYRVAKEKVAPPTDKIRPTFSNSKRNHVITVAFNNNNKKLFKRNTTFIVLLLLKKNCSCHCH
jgi:hypothetical protein